MSDKHDDRRVQRSRQMLQQALGDLIGEKPFDKITVQEIIDRAGVGRTTFYAHFQSKEDLFLSNHDQIVDALSRSFLPANPGHGAGEVWPAGPSPELVGFLEMMAGSRDAYFFLTRGSATGEVLRLVKERIARSLAARLGEMYREEDSAVPFEVLAQHVASAMVSVFTWWMDRRTAYSLQEIVGMVHRMNQVVLRGALEKTLPGE